MALFKKLFNSDSTKTIRNEFNWTEFSTENQLNSIIKDSHNGTQMLFKHSTRCFTSSMAKKQFEKSYLESNTEFKFYYLDVIANRQLARIVAERLHVRHESPQLLIIRDGKVDMHASHSDISQLPLQIE
ncbi:bacillithiol system redox-active protein YtxJ [Aegicerativicinus sediminis]